MDGTAHKPDPETAITLTEKPGFAGYLSKVLYKAGAVNTREAYQMYKEGYGEWIGSFFNRFKLNLPFYKTTKKKVVLFCN